MRVLVPLLILLAAGTVRGQLTTEQALRLAIENRPAVKAAQERVVAAQHRRRALGTYDPTRLLVGYSSPIEVGGSDDDLVLVQPLDFFGRTAASRLIGDAGVVMAEAELRMVLASVQAEVLDQLGEAIAAKALAENATETQEIARKLLDAIKALFAEGRVAGVQVTRVGIEVDRATLAAGRRKAELEASLQRLSGLLHLPVEQITIGGFTDLPAAPSSDLRASLSELQILSAEVQAAEAETRFTRLGSMPELEIQGRSTPWQERDRRFGLRVQLSIPLFDGGRVRSETAAAKSRSHAARKALEDAVRIAEAELVAARIEMTGASDEVARYQKIVDAAHSLVRASQLGFTEKAITLTELLEATRSLREVEEGLIEARLRLSKAQSRYLRASGHILEVSK